MLHELLCDFLSELAEQGRCLQPDDEKRLGIILEEKLEEYRTKVPSPNETVYERERNEFQSILRLFMSVELKREENCQPAYLEASIGLRIGPDADDIETEEPVALQLAPDKTIRVRGKVDRIDRVGDSDSLRFEIRDYKTGSTWKYDKEDPLWQGRVLQPYIYLQMVNKRLREEVSARARATRFHYLFLSDKEKGAEITGDVRGRYAGAGSIVQKLCRLMADGCFLATTTPGDDCTSCDYSPICGAVQDIADRSEEVLANEDNEMLEPMREIRCDE